MSRTSYLVVALVASFVGVAAPVAHAVEPTQEHPIVVADERISRGALEDATRRFQSVLADREISRGTAASTLIFRAMLRNEARRRDLNVRRPEAEWLDPTVARAIAAAGPAEPLAFVRRFRAFEVRWVAQVRCTPYWSVDGYCKGQPADCVWVGAPELCGPHQPPAPEKPFWIVSLWPPSFGADEEASYPLERAIRRRVARVPGLRARLGEFVNEGEISISALDERAAAILAREAYRLAQSRCGGRITRSCGRG